MHLQFLVFDRSEDADGVVCWDALAEPAPAYHQALLREVAQVLDWAHQWDDQGPGPLENGAQWDFDLQITLTQDGRPAQVARPRFVPSTGELQLVPEPHGGQRMALCLSLSGTPGFVQAFSEAFEGT